MKWGGHDALELFPVLVWLVLTDSVISPAAISIDIGARARAKGQTLNIIYEANIKHT